MFGKGFSSDDTEEKFKLFGSFASVFMYGLIDGVTGKLADNNE
jgi:hypothetical protein